MQRTAERGVLRIGIEGAPAQEHQLHAEAHWTAVGKAVSRGIVDRLPYRDAQLGFAEHLAQAWCKFLTMNHHFVFEAISGSLLERSHVSFSNRKHPSLLSSAAFKAAGLSLREEMCATAPGPGVKGQTSGNISSASPVSAITLSRAIA